MLELYATLMEKYILFENAVHLKTFGNVFKNALGP